MKLLSVLAILFSLSISAQHQLRKTTIVYKEIAGVKPDKLSLDIYNPSDKPGKPVVIFVHGGAWFLGDKSTKIANKVHLFSELGYVLVSVNYRLSSFFGTSVQYPDHPNDAADAVAWVYRNISKYGGNPENMVLMGHSAGAQIVSLLGTSEEFLPQRGIPITTVKGIASLDTEGYDVFGMGNEGVKIYRKIFGNDAEVWKKASPLYNIKADRKYPPFLLVTRGKDYRKVMTRKFAEALKNTGTPVRIFETDAYSHFEINNKIGARKDTVITPVLRDFLQEVLIHD